MSKTERVLTVNIEIDGLDEGYLGGGVAGLAAYISVVVRGVDQEGQLARHRLIARPRRARPLCLRKQKKDDDTPLAPTSRARFFAPRRAKLASIADRAFGTFGLAFARLTQADAVILCFFFFLPYKVSRRRRKCSP